MPGEIFYWVLNMSILGSVAGLVVLLLRRFRGLPRFLIYLMWILPLMRLWLPFGLANEYSLLSLISRFTTKTIVVWEFTPELTMTNSLQAAQRYFPIEYKTDLLRDIFNIFGMIWLIVAASAVFCSVLLYVFTKSAVKDAEHIRDNIYRSEKVLSPAVYGIWRAKIILPANFFCSDSDYILKHEQIHIRRRDNLWRVVALLTACFHWFNPLVWVFLKCFFSDMELACDAGVLKSLNNNDEKAYAAALLSCAAEKTYYASAFGGAKTRLRIENILSYKKVTLASGICFAAIFVVIAITLTTNAVGG